MTTHPSKEIRTLLIEDDEDDYLLTTELLSEIAGTRYDVIWHQEIPDIEAVFLSDKFDVALVDFQVGKWNGVELIREARSIGFQAPLILLTGLQEYEIDIAAADAGAADFLCKREITPQVLERAIRYAMSTTEARNALQQQSAVLRSTLDNTDTGIGAFNSARQLVACNVPFLQLLDIYDEAQNIDGFTISDPNSLSALSDRVFEKLSSASPTASSTTHLLESADKIVEIRRRKVADGGTVVICVDMTERVMNEKILRNATESAEALNRAKSVFLANMSHELRTPLNSIIGFSDIMNKQDLGPDQYRDYAGDIYASGKHLLALINDVLDISKIEAGEVELNEENTDLASTIHSSVAMLRERALTGGISLVTDISEGTIPLIHVDPRRLRQILINLLSNAVKFTERGGTATIKACYDHDSGYVIECADTGIGIAADDIPKALARFQQIDGRLSREFEGTGLGLPLTKALVELHGGTLDLQSQVDSGTTVTVRLPAERSVDRGDVKQSA